MRCNVVRRLLHLCAMYCRGTKCLFYGLSTERLAVSLLRTYKIVGLNETNMALHVLASHADQWNMQMALSAQDAQMSNLTYAFSTVALHRGFRIEKRTRLLTPPAMPPDDLPAYEIVARVIR